MHAPITQVLIFISASITVLEYLEIINEKQINFRETDFNDILIKLLTNPLYAGKISTFTCLTLYVISTSFYRMEKNIFIRRKESLIFYIIINMIIANILCIYFEIDFGLKFFILSFLVMTRKASPYSHFKVFIINISFAFSYYIFSFIILYSNFYQNLFPFGVCVFWGRLIYFWDQIPRLMSFAFLEKETKIERYLIEEEENKEAIDLNQLATLYLESSLDYHLRKKGLTNENKKVKDENWMFNSWKEHNSKIFLELKEKKIINFKEINNKIEYFTLEWIWLRNLIFNN